MNFDRRHLLSLLAILPLAGTVSLSSAEAYESFGLDLGRVWQVREYDTDGTVWVGTWTRRANSSVFDAQWRNDVTGGIAYDVIEFRGITGGLVTLHREQLSGDYQGYISADDRRVRRGSATWYKPGSYWEARILR